MISVSDGLVSVSGMRSCVFDGSKRELELLEFKKLSERVYFHYLCGIGSPLATALS